MRRGGRGVGEMDGGFWGLWWVFSCWWDLGMLVGLGEVR